MESIWSESVSIAPRKPLPGDSKVDVAVIGAGMAGILTAYYLQQRGRKVVVLEADRIAGGQTRNTTAKLTSQHGMCYQRLNRYLGRERAALYAKAHEMAINEYEHLIRDKKIDCHFERVPSYLYSTVEEEQLKQEAEMAAALGLNAYYVKHCEIPIEHAGAVCFKQQAQFHPLELIRELAGELTIYEDTRVNTVTEHVVYTSWGRVDAEQIVFACHYPFVNVPGFYFLRQHQERSYVLALSNAKRLKGMYYCADEKGISLRMAGDVLLFGGGAHRTGERKSGTGYEYLRKQAEAYYPDCKELCHWSAQDCMPHDEIPFIGRYSILHPDWYIATGFQKWGMTSSMVAAQMITSQICGQEHPYEKVFSPQRLHVRAGFANWMKDVGQSVKGLARGLVKPPARCTHMGCRLEWNEEEGTWDCPCHGSRFSSDGTLLDDPAIKDKTVMP
ncbi:MAG: FAD-dependent oxidoreductase [Lachnospira sp.]|nr:FAD-dependent oxidoreductase [Lachnospira sp.]